MNGQYRPKSEWPTPRHGMAWTPQEDRELDRLVRQLSPGRSQYDLYAEIGKRLGRSRAAIEERVKKHQEENGGAPIIPFMSDARRIILDLADEYERRANRLREVAEEL